MTIKQSGTIKAVAIKKKAEGEIGFVLQEHDQIWFNVFEDEDKLDVLLDQILQKGNSIEFEMVAGNPSNFTLIEKAKESAKSNFGDDIVNFEALLSSAHSKKEKFSIKTECISIDIDKKLAVFKARVIVSNGEIVDNERALQVFEGHGDASPDNVDGNVSKHWMRIAETRAIVRALRFYTNNAECAEEEK